MLTVIMAGGEGKRLRPLTCTMPKPMLPMLGKPVIEYILDLLISHRITDITVTTGYMGDMIKSHFENGKYRNVALKFSEEKVPLGTAGGVANAIGGRREEVLVISGDAICDFDISGAVNFHRRSGAAVTVIGKKVDDPREYGLMKTDSDGKVIKFTEKPDFGKVSDDLANTGVYILSAEVAASLPVGENSDFGKDIFPGLLSENKPVFVYEDKGYWCDIGSVRTYISCQHDMLKNYVKCTLPYKPDDDGNIILSPLPDGVSVIPPVYIGKNVVFGKTAVVGSLSVIEDGARILSGSKIKGGIIGKYASLSERTTVSGGIVGSHSILKRSSSVYEEGVLGEYVTVGESSVVLPFVKIWPHKEIPALSVVKNNVKFNVLPQEIFDDKGITGETGTDISPEFAVSLGRSVGSVAGLCRICLAHGDSSASEALCRGISLGINCGGKNTVNLGNIPLNIFTFGLKKGNYDVGIYVGAASKCNIVFLESDGFYISREKERSITDGYLRSEFTAPEYSEYGTETYDGDTEKAYFREFAEKDRDALSGMKFSVKSADAAITSVSERGFLYMGVAESDDLRFFITDGGTCAAAYSKETGYVMHNKLLALAVLDRVSEGKECAVFENSPRTIDEIADFYGKRVHRIWETSVAEGDRKARDIGKDEGFLTDGLLLVKAVVKFLKRTGLSLEKAIEIMPEFQTEERTVKLGVSVSEALSEFQNEKKAETGEGICIVRNKGTVYLKPLKRGKEIKIYTESRKAEYSRELCDEFERILMSKP